MNLKKGDNVKVLSGKDRNKTGKIMQAFPTMGKVVVEGVNKITKHVKTRKRGDKGQKIEYFGPINASAVALVCPKCLKATRVGHQVLADGKKVRICKKCKATIE